MPIALEGIVAFSVFAALGVFNRSRKVCGNAGSTSCIVGIGALGISCARSSGSSSPYALKIAFTTSIFKYFAFSIIILLASSPIPSCHNISRNALCGANCSLKNIFIFFWRSFLMPKVLLIKACSVVSPGNRSVSASVAFIKLSIRSRPLVCATLLPTRSRSFHSSSSVNRKSKSLCLCSSLRVNP